MKCTMLAHPADPVGVHADLDATNGYGTKMSPWIPTVRLRVEEFTSSKPQTRAALSTMASRTVCTSVGERLMISEDWPVAV